jgi:hypothetical protein
VAPRQESLPARIPSDPAPHRTREARRASEHEHQSADGGSSFRLPRDPFRLPAGVHLRVSPSERHPLFSGFDLRLGATRGNITWRTRSPLLFCRVLLSRDATLKGVERVIDATSRGGGTSHRVSLDNLEPDASYQLLVLGFPASGDPLQAPVVAFRTLPR